MNIKKEILNQLLDKYENSTHFRNEAKVNRKILVTMKPPLYVIEDTTQTKAVHMVLEELTEKNLVKVQWLQGHVNHIARQVLLNLDNVDLAYKEIKRQHKKTELTQVKELCTPQENDPDWLIQFLTDITTYVDTKHKVPAVMKNGHYEQQNLLIVLRAIAQLDGEEVLERVFSKRHLKDSKYFETHLRSKTARILGQYCLSRTIKSQC